MELRFQLSRTFIQDRENKMLRSIHKNVPTVQTKLHLMLVYCLKRISATHLIIPSLISTNFPSRQTKLQLMLIYCCLEWISSPQMLGRFAVSLHEEAEAPMFK